jgi:hypothetical protein
MAIPFPAARTATLWSSLSDANSFCDKYRRSDDNMMELDVFLSINLAACGLTVQLAENPMKRFELTPISYKNHIKPVSF